MRRTLAVTTLLLLIFTAVANAHDLFLMPVRYFATENADVLVRVLNGTFSKSENSIARPRVRDISVVSPAGRARLDTARWSTAGDTSTFSVHTGASGTYLLGASTNPNVIALKAKDFNEYLRTDGVPDVLSARRRDKQLQRPARERYSKHVKALIQVGSSRSDHFSTVLGYPAEIVPLENPYTLSAGGTLHVRTVVDGRAVASQYVLYGGRTPSGQRLEARGVRTNAEGVATIPLRQRGTWYVKFISMRPPLMPSDTVDYESRWATLTFQLR